MWRSGSSPSHGACASCLEPFAAWNDLERARRGSLNSRQAKRPWLGSASGFHNRRESLPTERWRGGVWGNGYSANWEKGEGGAVLEVRIGCKKKNPDHRLPSSVNFATFQSDYHKLVPQGLNSLHPSSQRIRSPAKAPMRMRIACSPSKHFLSTNRGA